MLMLQVSAPYDNFHCERPRCSSILNLQIWSMAYCKIGANVRKWFREQKCLLLFIAEEVKFFKFYHFHSLVIFSLFLFIQDNFFWFYTFLCFNSNPNYILLIWPLANYLTFSVGYHTEAIKKHSIQWAVSKNELIWSNIYLLWDKVVTLIKWYFLKYS